MTIRIDNEWGRLKRVIVGDGHEMGPSITLETALDPTSYTHVKSGTYPHPDDVAIQLANLFDMLSNEGVEVMNPNHIPGLEQVFSRDVGLVIEDRFYRSVMIGERQREWEGVKDLLEGIDVRLIPADSRMEGGDVLVLQDALAVGVTQNEKLAQLKTARTNPSAVDFLSAEFPHREILSLELHKHDRDPLRCALHLDCAFMPLGHGEAIVCRDAFLKESQLNALLARFSHVIDISIQEASELQSNLLHLDPDTLLIDPRFKRLSDILTQRGYRLLQVPLDQVGKMGGLFRCTTLPLLRT